MLSQNSSHNDEAISQCTTDMNTLVARSEEVLKQILQHNIKKHRENIGGCDGTFLTIFSQQG